VSRLVLDTNVVVSAFLAPRGNENKVLRLALSSDHKLCISQAILDEYLRILGKPKLKLRPRDIEDFHASLKQRASWIRPEHRLHVSPDESDNRFLECAETIEAEFLITGAGNKRHFPEVWKGTKIVNAREFLEQVVPL
jgi:putative PIN family toxin of toxin-antitoxin system